MGILEIPNELLLLVADDLPIKDLSHFHSTCRRLWSLLAPLTPHLYKRLLRNADGPTPLQWATEHGHAPLADLAISKGAEVNKPDRWKYSRTPLHSAAQHNHPAVIRTLVKHGASIAAKDRDSRTPLHLAASFRRVEATRALLELGADMTCIDKRKQTPAHAVASAGSVGCMEAFVDAGFVFNTRGPLGGTILHTAAFGGIGMLEYLLRQKEARAVINAQDLSGSAPLHYAIDCFSGAKKVKLLLSNGADVGVTDHRGNTPAQVAARLGNVGCLVTLIEAGIDIGNRGASGRTILHEAVLGGEQITKWLLGKGRGRIFVNAQDAEGSTPLHFAADRDSLETQQIEKVRLLLCCGADPRIKDMNNRTPVHIAAYRGCVDYVRAFIDAGFDINTEGVSGRTILHEAVHGGKEMMEYLLGEGGGRIIINAQDSKGSTPLHLAVDRGSAEASVLLIRYGADPGVKDSDGDTPADIAANKGDILLHGVA